MEDAADRRKDYTTDQIVVHWNAARCIHSANCLRGLPEVFNTRRRPWIMVDAASADRIADVVMTCPSGALHFTRLDGGPQEPDPQATLAPQPDGPLYVRGRM